MSVPTEGECYSRLIEHIRKAQEESAMLGHLANANDHGPKGRAWLSVSELFKQVEHNVTQIAMGRLQ